MATEATPEKAQSLKPALLLKAIGFVPKPWIVPGVLFLITWIIYIVTQTHYNTFDAVSYANQIAHLYPQTGDKHWLFHPHHLLYNALGYIAWRMAQAFGYHGGSLVILEDLNAFFGAAGVVLFYLILHQLLPRSRWLPFLIALGLALSYGYWICATDGRVNMLSTVLLIAAFMALLKMLEAASIKRAAITGLLAGLAVLFHESAGLFLLAGIAGCLLAELDESVAPAQFRKQRLLVIFAYSGTWSAVIGIPYLLIGTFALGLQSLNSFHHWMSTYSELGWWWNFQIPHNLRLDAYALRHAALAEPSGKQGTFHISSHVPAAETLLYFATLGGWFAAVYTFAAAIPLLWNSHYRRIMAICLLWIVLYGAFFTIWSPGYFVFWVPLLIPISLLIAIALSRYRVRYGVAVNWLAIIWTAMFATDNIVGGIAQHMQANSSPFQVIAQDIKAHTKNGDLIIVAGAGDAAQCEVDIPYFANRNCISLHTTLERAHEVKAVAFNNLQKQVNMTLASGGHVYALDELWHNNHTWDALQYRHPELQTNDLKSLFGPYRRVKAWRGPRQTIWEIKKNP